MVIITAAFCFLTNVPVIVNASAPLKQMSGFRFLQHLLFFYQWEEEIISSLRGAAELHRLQNSLPLTLSSFFCLRREEPRTDKVYEKLKKSLWKVFDWFSLPATFAFPSPPPGRFHQTCRRSPLRCQFSRAFLEELWLVGTQPDESISKISSSVGRLWFPLPWSGHTMLWPACHCLTVSGC